MSHPALEAEEYKARYMMLASGEPTERLERVAEAARILTDRALEMARTSAYSLHECIDVINHALQVSLGIKQTDGYAGPSDELEAAITACEEKLKGTGAGEGKRA